MELEFPDINNYTSRYNAHQVASVGTILVGILATDGVEFVSPQHAEQARFTHEAGMRAWHYHFARPEVPGNGPAEMAHFWDAVRPVWKAGDRLVLDVERTPPGGAGELAAYVREIDAELFRLAAQQPLAYMPDSLFRAAGPNLRTISNEFWIAAWSKKRIARLGDGRRMLARQHSNGQEGAEPFRCPGIGACDMNRLQRWYAQKLNAERQRK